MAPKRATAKPSRGRGGKSNASAPSRQPYQEPINSQVLECKLSFLFGMVFELKYILSTLTPATSPNNAS